MITEDQLEQLAIQWYQDTGGENIDHRTPNIEHRREEKRRLPEGVAAEREALGTLTPALSQGEREQEGRLAKSARILGSRQISRQSVARKVVGYRDMNRDPSKMLKPPWWAASLLLQHMADELPESRALTESVKVGIRTHSSYRAATHKDSFSVKIKSKGG